MDKLTARNRIWLILRPLDPLVALEVLHDLDESMTEWMAEWVRVARENGATWDQVGAALGCSRQSAWNRFH